MVPVLGREIVEGKQRLAILEQACDGALVLRRVLGREGGDCRLGGRSVGCQPDLAQVLAGVALQRLRQLVEDIGSLVDPSPRDPTAKRPGPEGPGGQR